MKDKLTLCILIAFAFAIGFGFNNFAMGNIPVNFKIAVVDVGSVVGQSAEVNALKKDQELKLKELQKWLVTVRADVEKQKTKEGKEKLIKKYDADFVKKQEAIKKDYTSKLRVIDKQISGVIAKEAKTQGYNMVLAKGVVLYGGEDITSTIIKKVK